MKTERKMIMLMLLLVVLLCGCKAEKDDKKPTEAPTSTATTQLTKEPTAMPTAGGETITVPEGYELVHRRTKETYYIPDGEQSPNLANKGTEYMVREFAYDEYGNCVAETTTYAELTYTKKSAYDDFGRLLHYELYQGEMLCARVYLEYDAEGTVVAAHVQMAGTETPVVIDYNYYADGDLYRMDYSLGDTVLGHTEYITSRKEIQHSTNTPEYSDDTHYSLWYSVYDQCVDVEYEIAVVKKTAELQGNLVVKPVPAEPIFAQGDGKKENIFAEMSTMNQHTYIEWAEICYDENGKAVGEYVRSFFENLWDQNDFRYRYFAYVYGEDGQLLYSEEVGFGDDSTCRRYYNADGKVLTEERRYAIPGMGLSIVETKFEYNADGRISRVSEETWECEYFYDDLGRLVRIETVSDTDMFESPITMYYFYEGDSTEWYYASKYDTYMLTNLCVKSCDDAETPVVFLDAYEEAMLYLYQYSEDGTVEGIWAESLAKLVSYGLERPTCEGERCVDIDSAKFFEFMLGKFEEVK